MRDMTGGRVHRFVKSNMQRERSHEEQCGMDRDAFEVDRSFAPLIASLTAGR